MMRIERVWWTAAERGIECDVCSTSERPAPAVIAGKINTANGWFQIVALCSTCVTEATDARAKIRKRGVLRHA